jgi:SpoVK/Ycf46/Vps4 family AAA+-type ATPase
MAKFWQMEERYRKHGLLYKRGILLWGPPGGGKTATITLLNKHLLDNGGVVVMCDHPKITSMGLEALRRIEPERRIICIMEDIDEIIEKYGEHDLLALLDGENQVDRIVMLASTNYPDRLGARICNRPSRFDERIKVGMPSRAARRVYLKNLLGENDPDIERWVEDTDNLSVAHLRELAAAVRCLDQNYTEVLDRLKTMKHRLKSEDGFGNKSGTTGF